VADPFTKPNQIKANPIFVLSTAEAFSLIPIHMTSFPVGEFPAATTLSWKIPGERNEKPLVVWLGNQNLGHIAQK
jgi:hypothetical protein